MSEYSQYLSPTEDIIEDARNGKMIVLVDAEDREKGDLIIPSQMVTPEAINFMAKFGRGLMAMPQDRSDQLGLELMSQTNRSRHQTAFTVSIRRARASPPASPRMTGRTPYPWRLTQPRVPRTSCRRAMCFRWLRAKAAF